jgi:DNA-directed RNA polymerase subunit RPC12/RpoP
MAEISEEQAKRLTEALASATEPVMTCTKCGRAMERDGWETDTLGTRPIFRCRSCDSRITVEVIP